MRKNREKKMSTFHEEDDDVDCMCNQAKPNYIRAIAHRQPVVVVVGSIVAQPNSLTGTKSIPTSEME